MKNRPSLSQYVKKRNGVPLGASGSLSNMLKNSFGASTLSQFWVYWNPIWSYYLRYFIFTPVKEHLPNQLARIITFLISGALHDVAVGLITGKWQLLCSIWFLLIGLVIAFGDLFKIRLSTQPFVLRAAVNLVHVIVPLLIALNLQTVI